MEYGASVRLFPPDCVRSFGVGGGGGENFEPEKAGGGVFWQGSGALRRERFVLTLAFHLV